MKRVLSILKFLLLQSEFKDYHFQHDSAVKQSKQPVTIRERVHISYHLLYLSNGYNCINLSKLVLRKRPPNQPQVIRTRKRMFTVGNVRYWLQSYIIIFVYGHLLHCKDQTESKHSTTNLSIERRYSS